MASAVEEKNPFEGFESLGKKKKEKLLKNVLRSSKVGNLEVCKRLFFAVKDNDYVEFTGHLKESGYNFYVAEFNSSAEYNGRPNFVLGNVLSGLTQQLESDVRSFFAHFTCTKNPDYDESDSSSSQYKFTSYWISGLSLSMDTYETYYNNWFSNFTFTKVETDDIINFLNNFKSGQILEGLQEEADERNRTRKEAKKAARAAEKEANVDASNDSDSESDSDSDSDESDSESDDEDETVDSDLLHHKYLH